MARVTYKTFNERPKSSSDFPKLTDILVGLSVNKQTTSVTRKLRMIGYPIEFIEYNAKKYVPGEKGKKVDCPFPDADTNKRITRIGPADKSGIWAELGYVGSRRFAQKCFELNEDKTWTHKILCKGPSVFEPMFNWEEARHTEEDPELSTFLGGENAPIVRIEATYNPDKMGNVDYKILIGSKDQPVTEDMINDMRLIREPSAEDLLAIQEEIEADRENDPTLAAWLPWYEYGHDIEKIFKTSVIESDKEESVNAEEEGMTVVDASEEVFTEVGAPSGETDEAGWDDITW